MSEVTSLSNLPTDGRSGAVDGGTGESLPGPSPEPIAWMGLSISIGLLLVAFSSALARTFQAWNDNPEYSHGFLMPLVAGWLLWERKEELRALPGATSLLSVFVLIPCVLGMLVGELDFLISVGPFAFVGALGAVVLGFLGWRGLYCVLPALVVLALACPLPGRVQQMITLPLKEVSTQLAVGFLHLSGVPCFLEGTMIHLDGADSLWVADACSGIRSFISLLTIAVVACLVWQRHWVLKVLVVVASLPIAIFVNGLRIWLTGYLSVHVGQEAAEGVFHFFEGFALFALAGLLLLAFAWVLGLLFPRSVE